MAAFLAILQALPAFFQSLPYLFQLLLKLMAVIEKFIAWSKLNNTSAWLDDLEVTIDKLQSAKNPEEKLAAGSSLVDLIRKLK